MKTKHKYDVRSAELRDIELIASDARQADIEELWAFSHCTPRQAMTEGFRVSRHTVFTGTADEEPICMFGVKAPVLLNARATPWMIASNKLKFHSRGFLRESRAMVKLLSRQFPHMQNFVDARNVVAIRWLQWVGFSVYYPEPCGAKNMPFHYFEMKV